MSYRVYKDWSALNLHFNTNYDYIKYNGKLGRLTRESYEKRNDRYFFEKIHNRYGITESFNYLLFCYAHSCETWIGYLTENEANENYFEYKTFYSSPVRNTKISMQELMNEEKCSFKDLFTIRKDYHPYLLTALISGKIYLDTFILLDNILNFLSVWDKHLKEDVVYQKVIKRISKYKPFLKLNESKYITMIKELLNV